jgi:hypothetical protein
MLLSSVGFHHASLRPPLTPDGLYALLTLFILHLHHCGLVTYPSTAQPIHRSSTHHTPPASPTSHSASQPVNQSIRMHAFVRTHPSRPTRAGVASGACTFCFTLYYVTYVPFVCVSPFLAGVPPLVRTFARVACYRVSYIEELQFCSGNMAGLARARAWLVIMQGCKYITKICLADSVLPGPTDASLCASRLSAARKSGKTTHRGWQFRLAGSLASRRNAYKMLPLALTRRRRRRRCIL